MNIKAFPCALFLYVLLTGCATSISLSDSAVDPDWDGDTPEKVMVIALAERRLRTPFESTFVAELRSRGFNAVTSTAYAPVLEDLSDESKIEAIIEQAGVDSALIIEATGFREPNSTAWSVAYLAAAIFADNYQQSRQMRAVVAAGALADHTAAAHYGIELQFFDIKSNRMVWTAKTRTFDAGDLDDLVIQLADVMINDLIEKDVIE